jgi:hypothetical protein
MAWLVPVSEIRTAKITITVEPQKFFPYLYFGVYWVLSGTSTLGLPL